MSDFVFEEVRQLLKSALELRQKYMELSLQEFCCTTKNMLDKELPPSSTFCVPDVLGGAKFTAAGDIMSSEPLFVTSLHACWYVIGMLVCNSFLMVTIVRIL